MKDRRAFGIARGDRALSGSARRLVALGQDSTLDALRVRLRELALAARTTAKKGAVSSADVLCAEMDARIAQTEIFLESQNVRRAQLPTREKLLLEFRAWKVEGKPFDIDFLACLARIASLKLGIRSRRHSEEEAIEISTGIKFQDIATIERRAVEIVLGRRRAAKNNCMEPASRIANQIRREWLQPVRSIRRNKGIPVSIATIIRTAVPILDKLAGEPIVSGIPTSRDLLSMKPAGMAALFAIVQLEYGSATPLQSVYEALLEFRKGK